LDPASAGVDDTEDNMHNWREVLYTASGLGQHISALSCSEGLRYLAEQQLWLELDGASAGVDNTEDNRRDWREVLYTAPGLGQYISGCIMFEETLYQSCADGKPFVNVLKEQGIVPGIKVDTGLQVSFRSSPNIPS